MSTHTSLKHTNQDFQSMKFPVFGLARYRRRVLVSGGAGARNVGIEDKLVRWVHADGLRGTVSVEHRVGGGESRLQPAVHRGERGGRQPPHIDATDGWVQ